MVDSPKKRERVPFHQSRTRLSADLEKDVGRDYVCRWFNDTGDRIIRAQQGGWEFVLESELEGRVGDKEVHGGSTDLNGKVSKIVTAGDGKNPVRGYLMKLNKMFHKEDQKAKEAIYDKVDEAIRAGASGGAAIDNQYGDVKVTSRSHS